MTSRKRVGAVLLFGALVILPALVHLGLRSGVRRRHAVARVRAAAQLKAWTASLAIRATAVAGLEIGRPFPQLPLRPPGLQDEAMRRGRRTIVMMVHSLNTDDALNELRGLRRLVDQTPGLALLLVTAERDYVVARQSRALSHLRIRYGRVAPEYLSTLHVGADPVVYNVDTNGVIVQRRVIDQGTRLSMAKSILQTGAGP